MRKRAISTSAKFDSFSDADIERMIAEDPDPGAPDWETLRPLLDIGDIRLEVLAQPTSSSPGSCAAAPVATIRDREQGANRTNPAMQALLRILNRIPEPALLALDDAASTA